jgi:hypothetical protein
MLPSGEPPEPWRSFFSDLDQLLGEPVILHCFGGFVLIYLYGVARTTNDCDFVSLIPNPLLPTIAEIAGEESELQRRHGVYLDPVTVATPPESYEERLIPLFPGMWKNLRLYGLEAHDLALTKLERDYTRDQDDVSRLARAGHLHPEILKKRYHEELRPYLARETWHDQTLSRWIEFYFGESAEG